jgi:integrase
MSKKVKLGSISHQVHILFGNIDCQGKAKDPLKKAFYKEVRRDQARVKAGKISPNERLKGTTSNLADRMGTHGKKTADYVRDEWERLGEYTIRERGEGIKTFDMRTITPVEIKEFCSWRFAGGLGGLFEPLDPKTCRNINGYMTKFEQALAKDAAKNGVKRESHMVEIRKNIASVLPPKEVIKETIYKNHLNPDKVIKTLKNIAIKSGSDNAYKSYLAACILRESGCRSSVVTLINDKSMTQIADNGVMSYKTKAGQLGSTIHGNAIRDETVRSVRDYMTAHDGEFRLNKMTLSRWIHKAEKIAGDRCAGAHGFRFDRAKETYNDYRDCGATHAEALRATSEMLDHHRSDVAMLYLRHCEGVRF